MNKNSWHFRFCNKDILHIYMRNLKDRVLIQLEVESHLSQVNG